MVYYMSTPDIKKRARTRLYSNWLLHIAAPLCVAASLLGILFAGASVVSALDTLLSLDMLTSNSIGAVFLVLFILAAIPLFYGLFVFFQRSAAEKPVSLLNLFHAFSSFRVFRRSFALFWAMLWRAVVHFAVPSLLFYEASLHDIYGSGYFYPVHTFFGIPSSGTELAVCGTILLMLALAHYTGYFYAVDLALIHDNKSVSLCFSAGAMITKGKDGANLYITYLVFSFIPLLVLSILTFGILLLVYTLPYLLLSTFTLTDRVCKNGAALDRSRVFFDSHT